MSSSEQRAGYLHDMTPPAVMLAAALLTTLVINFVAQRSALWHWFPIQYQYSIKLYALATDPTPYDIVIIGSSVSNCDLIPQAMEAELNRLLPRPKPWLVYNASQQSGFFPIFIATARYLVDRRPRPRLALVMLAPLNFNSGADMNLNIECFTIGLRDFFTVMRHTPRNDARWAAVNSLTHGLTALYQAPLIRRDRGQIRELQARHGAGYQYPFTAPAARANFLLLPSSTRPLADLKAERLSFMRTNLLLNFSIRPLVDRWMREMIALLQSADIPVMVTLAPESAWFLKTNYHGERDQVTRYLSNLAAQDGLIYVDLSRPPYDMKDAEFFDGSDHLGFRGAERLSREIAANLLVPALAGQAR